MRPLHATILAAAALPVLGLAGFIGLSSWLTERDIGAHMETVRQIGLTHQSDTIDAADLRALPEPVQRYFAYALPDPTVAFGVMRLTAEGEFRRPLTEGFAPMTSTQTIATGTPALMFAGTTWMGPGIWARAYDFFAEGEMEMRAKVVSSVTVVNESATDALNRTSLRRWLLESPLYPMGLLPGGPVRWEAIDDSHARAIVSGFGLEASLVASFRPDGSLASFQAEGDGDLTTPYHGSGEYVSRDDYRPVAGMMIPHDFTIARAAQGEIHPFWHGRITAIAYE